MTPISPAALSASPPQKRRWLKRAAIFLLLALAAASLLTWRAQASKKPEKPAEAEKVFEFATADIAHLAARELGQRIPVSGSVRPVLQAVVKSRTAAEVAGVQVREGDKVTAGEVLFTLDSRDLRAQLERAEASVAEARARHDLARKTEDNNRQLLTRGFISQAAFDAFANTVATTAASLKSAEADATIARKALQDASVRAPFAGLVAKRMVNRGDKVSPDSPLLQLVDLGRMELEAMVPVSEIPHVAIGQEIAFKVDGFEGREFTGKVERINPSAEAGSRAIAVFVAIPNADHALKGGMFASGFLAANSRGPVNTLPVAAIQEESGQHFVFIVKDGLVDRRPVTIGQRNADQGMVEVKEGLDASVAVVAVKTAEIKTGAKAMIKSATVVNSSMDSKGKG
ncbi:MAG: efflux RND transporter periplasmic adaptor subunit [Betaproteobacteria bacterium]|nr:efflux RND transporter periplasmic adaptor subunit [Betaproteobacteria bacterium]